MTLFGKIVAVILILAVGAIGAKTIFELSPQAERVEPPRIVTSVEAISVKRQTISVSISSQGEMEPLTETQVAAEVPGKVIRVSPKFEVGESFSVDEVILEIDPADFVANVAQAESTLAEAQLALETEQARARQAEAEWNKLGGGDEPSDLVLRKPQLKSARARITAAEAALEKAERDLDRTVIRAPYACRVRTKHTDIGSYLAPGAPVVDLYRTDALEVRLPVALEDYALIETGSAPEIELSATIAGQPYNWKASLERTEGVVDRTSRSVFLVGRIDPDSVNAEAGRFLTPGMFVRASVSGVPFKNMFRVPREAIYGMNQVLVISDEGTVSFREVDIARTEQDYVVIRNGLTDGEKISVTVLETVIDGETEVEIATLDGVPQAGQAPAPAQTSQPETEAPAS